MTTNNNSGRVKIFNFAQILYRPGDVTTCFSPPREFMKRITLTMAVLLAVGQVAAFDREEYERTFSADLRSQRFTTKDSAECGNPKADLKLRAICLDIQKQWFKFHEPIQVDGLKEPLTWEKCEPGLKYVWAVATDVIAECEIRGNKAVEYFLKGR